MEAKKKAKVQPKKAVSSSISNGEEESNNSEQ